MEEAWTIFDHEWKEPLILRWFYPHHILVTQADNCLFKELRINQMSEIMITRQCATWQPRNEISDTQIFTTLTHNLETLNTKHNQTR